MMNELDPRKELFDLINFDGFKVAQVSSGLLDVDLPKLTCKLYTLHCGNTCFSDIVKLYFVKNIIRGSKLLHQVFDKKIHHFYAFFQKLSVSSSMAKSTTAPH